MSEEIEETSELDEQQRAQLEEAHRFFLSEVMNQLLKCERFVRFFKINYEVQQYINKEEKTVDIRVIERPPEIAMQHLQNLAAEHAKEHTPTIQTATAEEIAAIAKENIK